ncbi:hypothetical protein [Streptococcus cuniculi]|uniref:hypothetical protein n=1 Tax=Streptococcus cuniculi TaxID=1432788 RepID=UPI001D162175|nr:hypothetical protein [Streptococcus cuniculi]
MQVRTANPKAMFTPFAIEDSKGKVNSVQKAGVGGFVVVRKGFQKPELIVKMLNLIFDEVPNSSNMEEEYPEIYEYAKAAVDGSVRPINIEMFQNLSEIDDAMIASDAAQGNSDISSVSNFTIKNNAMKMKNFIDNASASDPTDWAVYSSRLLAINHVMNGVRNNGSYREVNPIAIFQKIDATERNGPQVTKLEEETFIKFVTGEKSLYEFDTYVKEWNEQGGHAIVKEMARLVGN